MYLYVRWYARAKTNGLGWQGPVNNCAHELHPHTHIIYVMCKCIRKGIKAGVNGIIRL